MIFLVVKFIIILLLNHKTIAVVRSQYFLLGMKKDVVDYIAKCIECQRVKDKHKYPSCLLQRLPIIEWKWKVVTIDFINKFPMTAKEHDSIMVVVDKLTNAAHFILFKLTHRVVNIPEIYLKEIVMLHKIPMEIILDKDWKFTSNFWK
jgi:hypothetical protein